MQIITFQKGFYFLGKMKDLQLFLAKTANRHTTVQEFVQFNLQ